MMLGSVMLPTGFFLAGWTSDPDIHWFPSVVGFTLIGVSFLLIFQVCTENRGRSRTRADGPLSTVGIELPDRFVHQIGREYRREQYLSPIALRRGIAFCRGAHVS